MKIIFTLFLILICDSLFAQNKLIGNSSKNTKDSIKVANIISEYKLSITEKKIFHANNSFKDTCENLLKLINSKRLYHPTDQETWIPTLLLETDYYSQIISKKPTTQLLNIYDSLMVDISRVLIIRGLDYFDDTNEFDPTQKLITNILLPEMKIKSFVDKNLISQLLWLGQSGLSSNRRINDNISFLTLTSIFLKPYRATQFYIHLQSELAEIYFSKDLFPLFDECFFNIYYSLDNKEMQTIENINILRDISYMYFYFGIGENIGGGGLKRVAELIDIKNLNDLKNLKTFDQLYLSCTRLSKTQYSILLKNPTLNESIEILENLSKKTTDKREKSRIQILLADNYLEVSKTKSDSMFKQVMTSIKVNDLNIFVESYNFLKKYFYSQNKNKLTLTFLEKYSKILDQIDKGNGNLKKEINKSKIEIIQKSNLYDKLELKNLIDEELYQLTYSYRDNIKIFPDYLRISHLELNRSYFSFYSKSLFEIDAEDVKLEDLNFCKGEVYYRLYDFLNVLKGSVANTGSIDDLIEKKKKINFPEFEFAINTRKSILEKLQLANHYSKFDSLIFLLNEEELAIRSQLNPMVRLSEPVMNIDSLLNKFNGNTIFVNIMQISKDLKSNEYVITYQIKQDTSRMTFIVAQKVKITNVNKNPYEKLWQMDEVRNLLTSIPFKNIIICPDGEFNKFSFNTVLFDKNSYVIDVLRIRYISKPINLMDMDANTPNNSRKVVIFGNPNFNDNPKLNSNSVNADSSITISKDRSGIMQLPFTQLEVNEINKTLKEANYSVEVFTQENATEKNLKFIKSPKILHIATHGFYIRKNNQTNSFSSLMGFDSLIIKNYPLFRSGLLLTDAAKQVYATSYTYPYFNDGILSAYEVENLNLKNTELVVLSACETGKGVIENAEGVYGLPRSFQMAGAKSVILSLNKVPDESTKILMTKFYSNWIIKKMPKYLALKTAQIEMKNSTKYSNPINWASFVLIE